MGTQKLTMNTNWKRFNIAENKKELRIDRKVSFPSNLYVIRRSHSPNLYGAYLPPVEDDPRPKTNKKRREYTVSTGTSDARNAALMAITWVKELQRELVDLVRQKEEKKTEKSLADYWNVHLPEFVESKKEKNSFEKLVRDEKNKWNSPTYGLSKEEFAHKNVDLISRKDFESYFRTLSKGMQSQQKTLIKKLLILAETDFVGHQFPSFPVITKPQKQQVTHFDRNEWEALMGCINKLSGGIAREHISYEQYQNLEFSKFNRKNQRNWVDLFDAIWVEYYWFLRSQDMDKLKIEWFREESEHYEYTLTNQDPKSGRTIVETRNINPEGYKFFQRLLNRRNGKGFLICPNIPRKSEGGGETKTIRTLNMLLKSAVEIAIPQFPVKYADLTTIRHTTLRHHLEDDPSLGDRTRIVDFAKNALTSPEMLQKTYLDYISRESSLRDSKSKMRSSEYSFIKRVQSQ